MTDVGDGVELALQTSPGATVTAVAYAPGGTATPPSPCPEDPDAPGVYPFTFLATSAGMWRAEFTASGTVTAVESAWVWVQEPGLPPLATVDQLVGMFGPLSDEERAVATARLDVASRMLRDRFPDLDARIAAGTLDPLVAAAAVMQMVQRVPNGRSGLRAETVGPFRREFSTDAAFAGLMITAAEVAMLAPRPAGGTRPKASTIRVGAGLGFARPDRWYGHVRRW